MGRVLGTVLALAALMLGGCSGEAGTNPPEQGEQEDVGRVTEETPATTPTPVQAAEKSVAVPASGSAGAEVTSEGSALPSVNASASVDTSRMDNFDCRIQAHVLEEGMNEGEVAAFTEDMTDRVVADMDAGGDKDVGDILDDMGVPAYEDQCGPPL